MEGFSQFANPTSSGFGRLIPETLRNNAYNLVPRTTNNDSRVTNNDSRVAENLGGGGVGFTNVKSSPMKPIEGLATPNYEMEQYAKYEKDHVVPKRLEEVQPQVVQHQQSAALYDSPHFSDHLDKCPECKNLFKQSISEAVKEALQSIIDLSPEAFENYKESYENGTHGKRHSRYWNHWKKQHHNLPYDEYGRHGGWDIQSILVGILIVILFVDLALRRSR